MTENAKIEKKAVSPAAPAQSVRADDLSKEMERTLERTADEHIRVVRVFDDHYRCNWWVQDKSPHPFWLATGTIRKSRFVKATRSNDRLVVEDVKSAVID
jgi:hypothetical protein